MYTSYSDKIFKRIPNGESHQLFKSIERLSQLRPSEKLSNIDDIFVDYILESYPQSNREYFQFLVKFVTLFRECINKLKNESGANTEYSQTNPAEQVPDYCNEFITDFMENNDYFGLDTNELIDIIQHFCNWLYENKYTTSRLTLLA